MDFLSQLMHQLQAAPPKDIKYPRANPDTGFYQAAPTNAPQPAIKYPRSNPDTGYYQASPTSKPRMDTSGYQPRKGGAMVYGATIPNAKGLQLQEDDFTFPEGGQFDRNPDGSVSINGAFVPQRLGLQEDSFRFQPQQRQVAQDPLADLRKLLGF